MSNRNIVVPVMYDTFGYDRYKEFIRPFLDVFGMPYDEVPAGSIAERLNRGAALVLLAQPGLTLSEEAAGAVARALEGGCGLVSMDDAALHRAEFSHFCTAVDMPSPRSGSEFVINGGHYITSLHDDGDRIPLYSADSYYINTVLTGGSVLVCAGKNALLEAAKTGGGRVVLWHDMCWCSPDILGPLHGMDDILKRSIVWAAKKPFVIKDMPPFVGMRVDDVWGSWRDVSPKQPLLWLEIANNFKLKPWLGVFQDNIDDISASIVRNYVRNGRASAFPHAFAGCEWVASPIPEHWLYFDHRLCRPYSDEVMAENAARAKAWFDDAGIPISKLALAHYYEMGENAIKHLIDWGCEFTGIHMMPDSPYRGGVTPLCGPYRKYSHHPSGEARPVYYADYLSFPHNLPIDKKLFNCVTEIRDVRGYELAPSNDVEHTIDSGVRQLRRAITSSVPATLFTHESCWIQRVTPENWELEIAGITDGISDLKPIYDTLDNICKYVRANHNIRIENAEADELGNLDIRIGGTNDMATKCRLFDETGGVITEQWRELPQAGGVMCPCNIY